MSDRNRSGAMSPEQAELVTRLNALAERGDGDAACRLGDLYREAAGGVRYSPKQTFRWYARSALAGDAWGQNNLGACHEHGLGCEQSYPNAVKWYRLAAAQGHATAMMNLGYCYLSGHGVSRDTVEALRLFRLAVEGGEERAAQEVERIERQADPRASQSVRADTPVTRPRALARPVIIRKTGEPGMQIGLVPVGGVRPLHGVSPETRPHRRTARDRRDGADRGLPVTETEPRVERIVQWTSEDLYRLHELVTAPEAEADRDPSATLTSLLVTESATSMPCSFGPVRSSADGVLRALHPSETGHEPKEAP